MKKLIIFVIIIFSFFNSCTKEDDILYTFKPEEDSFLVDYYKDTTDKFIYSITYKRNDTILLWFDGMEKKHIDMKALLKRKPLYYVLQSNRIKIPVYHYYVFQTFELIPTCDGYYYAFDKKINYLGYHIY